MSAPAPSHIVTFKAEDEEAGEDVGPVLVVDVAARDADPEFDPTSIGRPFGKRYAGETDHGWLTRSAALAIAAQHGVGSRSSRPCPAPRSPSCPTPSAGSPPRR